MALSIKDPEADRLARELARETGESLTEAIVTALRERAARHRRFRGVSSRREKLRAWREQVAALPVLDDRDPDEILGYNEAGLPE